MSPLIANDAILAPLTGASESPATGALMPQLVDILATRRSD